MNNSILDFPYDENKKYLVKQQDSPLLRQIRLITKDTNNYIPYLIFLQTTGGKKYEAELSNIILNGFVINKIRYTLSERSASMTRMGILSFVDESIAEELNKRITMDIHFQKAVLSKYYAYRGLMLSSCHLLENWLPKIIIVPDYYRFIMNQRIKYLFDKECEFIDNEGTKRKWLQKEIAEKIQDVKINAFDGCGIHHPLISKYVEEFLEGKNKKNTPLRMTSILWRAPYIKGVTHEINYEEFLLQNGITEIKDIWGISHDFSEPMLIMTESMYKGKSYFCKFNDARDWNLYWDKFKKYNHCIGVAKWNSSLEEEPAFTRANYQILQDLNLTYNDFSKLAKDSVEWVEKVINGDAIFTYCFLGLFANRHNEMNDYLKAILKNPVMIKESSIRKYFISLLKKYMDEMKAGKLWMKSCFKILAPDLIMFLQWIGGLETKGCLENDEFFTFDQNGSYQGKYLIERNPHICKSEHTILKGVDNDLLQYYCSHLTNVCMINSKSITAQRLNGADMDGDLVLVVDNATMLDGVEKEIAVVMDIEDKVTALAEENTLNNRLSLIMRTMNSLIGETSNCATGYHNKMPKSLEQKKKYESYIDLLSVINGKAIDYAKTGVQYNIPKYIAKYSKPLPYFMKYASNYYSTLQNFSKASSNMNRLCFELEKWENTLRYHHKVSDFDHKIMIDSNIKKSNLITDEIESLFLEFCSEMKELAKDQASIRSYGCKGISRYDTSNFILNWREYYQYYENRCSNICPNEKMLANIAVELCYEKYPNKNKKFMWVVASKGILENITQRPVKLPLLCGTGEFEYLGKHYTLKEMSCTEMEEYTNDR